MYCRTKKGGRPSCVWAFLYLNCVNGVIDITLDHECVSAFVVISRDGSRDVVLLALEATDILCRGDQRMYTATPSSRLDVEQAEARIAWVTQARCREVDPDQLFVRGAAQRKAATICRHCPVLMQCGADALDNRVEFGVWGGMTERQRRALLKQHPDVDSWSEFFEDRRHQQSTAV